jgi:hypothetical protein
MPGTTTSRKTVKAVTGVNATAKKPAAKKAAKKPPATAKPRNAEGRKLSAKSAKTASTGKAAAANDGKPRLLSGGNPQIPKGYGDAPVQAYIAAMPGWKSAAWRRLDQLIERTVPHVRKAVKWNSPLYGMQDDSWFLGVHCFERYIKVSFFRGASLQPVPPGKSKMPHVRYLDIHQDDALDEAQFEAWVKQASKLPGERM